MCYKTLPTIILELELCDVACRDNGEAAVRRIKGLGLGLFLR